MLLPCPPHQISPLWKQNNRSMMKQMSHINHWTRIIKQSSPNCSWTKTSPSPWLQQLPHTYHKTMVAPLGHLHHQATAKSSTLYRGHLLASAKPFPRPNIGTRKTDVSLKADKQHLVLLRSSKLQPEFSWHPSHQKVDSSGLYCHFPKICRCHNQPAEKLPNFNQKLPIPSLPSCQTSEVPPFEDHEEKTKATPRTFPASQDSPTYNTMSPGSQDETSLKSRQNCINLKPVIVIPSCDNEHYSWATAFESPSETQPKISHPNLGPRSLGVAPLHLYQNTRDTPSPSPEEEAPIAQASFPMEVECWETTPPKTDDQTEVVTDQDSGATSPLLALDLLDKTLPGLDYLDTSPLNLKQLAKEFEHWKVLPPERRHQAATQTVSDYGKDHPSVSKAKIPPDHSHEATTQTSIDHWAKDISNSISSWQVDVSTQTEEYWKTKSLETEQPSITQGQDDELTLHRSSGSQVTALHQSPYSPGCDHWLKVTPDALVRESFSADYIKLPGGSEHQTSSSLKMPPNHENQDKSGSDSTDYQQNHITSVSLNDQVTAQPRPTHTPKSLPSSKHQTETLRGPQFMAPDSNQDQIQNGLQHQVQTLSKRQVPWGFNYIKPFVIEGDSVPAKIVQTIIKSIPQEKIKDDMRKLIHLWKTGEPPTHWSGQFFSSNYIVCLVCVSWIPHGCPHVQRTKYPCVTQLLAIPMPLPGSKQKLNVKFAFQVSQTTAGNIFSLPYTHYCLQRPLRCQSANATSSHSDLVLSEPMKKKWLHFMLGKNHQQGEKAKIRSRQPHMKKMPKKRQKNSRGGSKGIKTKRKLNNQFFSH
ncbi:uncharacterized protein LOC141521586 [Macrotis lagotis]|uniref:uncharacterized protein LOC141521586 n=1 Tax=Macrotis lagotis TaxID=92651 RepID=UPI003D687692